MKLTKLLDGSRALRGGSAGPLFAAVLICGVGLAACNKKTEEKSAEAPAPAEPSAAAAEPKQRETLTLGFIYVGPRDDFGYNQAHAEAAKALAAMPGIQILEEEKVAETIDVQRRWRA